MHGMLSAAIIVVAFALVAAAGGGSTVWMYRAVSGPSRRSRPSAETVPTASEETTEPAPANPETIVDLPAPDASAAPDAPAADAAPATHGDNSEPADVEGFEGARIYVLDSSRRSGR